MTCPLAACGTACTYSTVPIMHFGCLFVYMQKDSMEVVQEKTAYFWRRRKTLRETRKKEDERVMTEEVGRVVHDGLAASLLLPLCLCCLRGDAGI